MDLKQQIEAIAKRFGEAHLILFDSQSQTYIRIRGGNMGRVLAEGTDIEATVAEALSVKPESAKG